MLQYLKPISQTNAISRVIASVFIPQAFLKPQDIFEKTKDIEGFKSYPKKGTMKATTININNNSFGISEDQIRGFIFESYDDKGSIDNIFKLENIMQNQSILSIENRKYKSWQEFKSQVKSDLGSFSSKNDFYVAGIGLNYIDEFLWTSDEDLIPVSRIFNTESQLLNKKFLSSTNGTLILFSQGKNTNNLLYEEKTEISFNNDIKRIIINHQYVIRFDNIKLFSTLETEISAYYDKAHIENKEILKDVLSLDSQRLINLT